ncbi:MAG: tetratricopeptide repeat protein [Verrucomicrobiota bacterium]
MKSLFFPGACALLLTCTPLLWAQSGNAGPNSLRASQDSPSAIYLQGHLILKEGTDKEKAGDFAGAYFKYRDARDLFDATHRADPAWQQEVVDYRRRLVRDDMERVRQLEIKRRAAGGEVSLSGIVGSSPDPADVMPKPGLPASGRNTAEVMDERMRGLQQQIDALTKRNEEIVQKLGAREEELRNANRDLLASRQSETELRNDLENAKTLIQTAGASEKRRNETLTKRVTELEGQLKGAVEKLTAANDKSTSLLADLEKAYGEIKQRTRERDDLQKERDEMAGLIAGSDNGKGIEKLKIIEDNKRLRRELESAQSEITRLTSEKTADIAQISVLKKQVQGVQEELAKFQQDNADYRQQITALTTRLDETSRRLGEVAEGAVPEVEASMENKVLRGLILQQLKQQAKREAAQKNVLDDLAHEGVLEKMNEMGVETEKLMRSLHEMAAAVPMTKEQRGLLSNSKLESYLMRNGVGELMMTQDVEELKSGSPAGDGDTAAAAGETPPGSPGVRDKAELSPELKAYANAAEDQFAQGDYTSAESQYRKILLVDPINVYALVNMGVTQMRQSKNEEAKENILKALAFDYDRGSTHYLLGMLHMRMNNMDKAVEEIQEGLKLEPQNANAHLALGVIAFQNKRPAEAERELKQAIVIDPSCAMAHFNLAVIYAGDEKKLAQGREHYRQAIRNGSEHDSRMDSYYGI